MKVGILPFFGWRDRSVPLNSVYETALERFSIMDTTGYDAIWLVEHHFSGFSVCPSVHMMGAMAAARTKRLRIGSARLGDRHDLSDGGIHERPVVPVADG